MPPFNWQEEVEKAFGREDVTPWIKLEVGVPFTGKIKNIAGRKTNSFGAEIIEVWFDSNEVPIGERNLDLSKSLAREFAKIEAQAGDTVTIIKSSELAHDKEGNPVFEKNPDGSQKLDESGQPIQQSYTRFKVAKEKGIAKATASPVTITKSAAIKDEDIDVSDIPF